jgi:hypothetical protein
VRRGVGGLCELDAKQEKPRAKKENRKEGLPFVYIVYVS